MNEKVTLAARFVFFPATIKCCLPSERRIQKRSLEVALDPRVKNSDGDLAQVSFRSDCLKNA